MLGWQIGVRNLIAGGAWGYEGGMRMSSFHRPAVGGRQSACGSFEREGEAREFSGARRDDPGAMGWE